MKQYNLSQISFFHILDIEQLLKLVQNGRHEMVDMKSGTKVKNDLTLME